jgi:hypothetical protein
MTTETKIYNYPRIPDDDYSKAIGQLKLQVNGVLNCFRCYGMDHDVDIAIREVTLLAEQFAMRVRGKDEPILVRTVPRERPTD